MPTMYEIYEKHASRYHAMVEAEDYQGNLRKLLHQQVTWANAHVLEAGVGTGRVTALYINQAAAATCCDRSAHMMALAEEQLLQVRDKLTFVEANNLDLPHFKTQFDIFIQGWSFGHQIMDCESETEIKTTIGRLVENASKHIRPGGTLIFIETLGSNQTHPEPPHEKLAMFYEQLEHAYGFTKHEIRTDYKYQSVDDAAAKMGFFFGDEMAAAVRQRREAIIPEWTGVWIKRV